MLAISDCYYGELSWDLLQIEQQEFGVVHMGIELEMRFLADRRSVTRFERIAVYAESSADKLDPGMSPVRKFMGYTFTLAENRGIQFYVLIDVNGSVVTAA